MKFSDFIVKEAIVSDIKATSRDGAIHELVESLAASGAIDSAAVEPICKAILDREKHGSTGFGKGVAVPHAKVSGIKKHVATIGRSSSGVDFAALDQAPVYSIVLLLSPPDSPSGHLQAMENIFRNLQQDTFRRFLRQAASKQAIIELIEEADQAGAAR
ncbi:MAG TPA: PTS sugar transporter subunit IIA [Phycisphaerae bacterium]|nr:PTS sugar transporter subunit IIA [Phycisphaerae bacterium]